MKLNFKTIQREIKYFVKQLEIIGKAAACALRH